MAAVESDKEEEAKREALVKHITVMLERQRKWVFWFSVDRLTVKFVKIVAALGAGFAALITALSGSSVAAILTAITGLLTALLAVIETEFRIEKKRRHHTYYLLKFEQLLDDLAFERNITDETLLFYSDRFHRLKAEERRANFAIEDEEGTPGRLAATEDRRSTTTAK